MEEEAGNSSVLVLFLHNFYHIESSMILPPSSNSLIHLSTSGSEYFESPASHQKEAERESYSQSVTTSSDYCTDIERQTAMYYDIMGITDRYVPAITRSDRSLTLVVLFVRMAESRFHLTNR